MKHAFILTCLVVGMSASAQIQKETSEILTQRPTQIVAPLPEKMSAPSIPVLKVPETGRMSRRNIEKPKSYYTAGSGYYNLVPGFAMTFDNMGTPTSYTTNGILGYIDRDLYFINRTPEYDSVLWDFYGETAHEDTVKTHPLFTNQGFTVTPKMTTTLNGVDSLYQMGAQPHVSIPDSIEEGIVSLAGLGFVYNVDVDVAPFSGTSYFAMDDNNPWNTLLFGCDTEVKPVYMEVFEKPYGGPVVLSGTHFYVWTPTTVDLSNKSFTVTWAEEDKETGSWNEIKKFTKQKAVLCADQPLREYGIRLWELFMVADDLSVMVENAFSVMISGPHDGTQWALMCHFRGVTATDASEEESEAMGNTAYYIATEGDLSGQVGQYVVQMSNATGVLGDYVLHMSLDIHQRILAPYMLIADRTTLNTYTDKNFDLSTDGETLECYLSDWFGSADEQGVAITAAVSESTDGDWLTVTAPKPGTGTAKSLFEIDIKAGYLDIDTEGRRATVTLTDNQGYSRDIVVYQGDREAADLLLSVDKVNATGEATITSVGESFCVTYPEGSSTLRVYTVDGACVANSALLAAGGVVNVPAATWKKGLYMFSIEGDVPQVIKVVK